MVCIYFSYLIMYLALVQVQLNSQNSKKCIKLNLMKRASCILCDNSIDTNKFAYVLSIMTRLSYSRLSMQIHPLLATIASLGATYLYISITLNAEKTLKSMRCWRPNLEIGINIKTNSSLNSNNIFLFHSLSSIINSWWLKW